MGRLDSCCPKPGATRGLGEAGTDPPHPAHTAIRDSCPQGCVCCGVTLSRCPQDTDPHTYLGRCGEGVWVAARASGRPRLPAARPLHLPSPRLVLWADKSIVLFCLLSCYKRKS